MKKMLLRSATLALGLTLAAGSAQAAECQLRNLSFVSTTNDGRLVINAEMWTVSGGAWIKVGTLNNSTYCRVSATYNSIATSTCQAWHSMAMAAFLGNKKIYIGANSCPAGNGTNLSGISLFGLSP